MIFNNTDFVIGPRFRSYEIINFEFIALSILLGAFVTAVHILVWTQSAVSNVLIAQENSNIIFKKTHLLYFHISIMFAKMGNTNNKFHQNLSFSISYVIYYVKCQLHMKNQRLNT